VVSAQKQSDYSDDYYTFVTFTVENKSDQILRIKAAELNFNQTDDSKVSVLVGDDLVSWAKAEQEQLDQSKHNRKLAKLALIIGGALLGGIGNASHSDLTQAIGAGALIGGAAWSVSDAIHSSQMNGQNPQRVPTEHIYAPFSVPIGKFLRKWAVIQHPKGTEIKNFTLRLETVTGHEATYEIKI
jgi:hypothetical protein